MRGLVVFVNNDLGGNTQSVLMQQLFISESISLNEYNARLAGNPSYYPTIIQQNDIRLLVIDSFYNLTNRSIFDIIAFCKAGEFSVISCRGNGAPGITFPIARLSTQELYRHFPCLHDFCFDGYGLCCDGYGLCCDHQTIQNNILFPLDGRVCGPRLFPFGERCNSHELVPLCNPYNLPIFVKCRD